MFKIFKLRQLKREQLLIKKIQMVRISIVFLFKDLSILIQVIVALIFFLNNNITKYLTLFNSTQMIHI